MRIDGASPLFNDALFDTCITMLTSLLYKDGPVLFKPSTKMLIIHPVMCNISVAYEVG